LTLEEVWAATEFATKVMGLDGKLSGAGEIQVAMQLTRRSLTKTEAVLISPDFAPNARAFNLLGYALGDNSPSGNDWRANLEQGYQALLSRIRQGQIKKLLIVGDHAVRTEDLDAGLQSALRSMDCSVAISAAGPEGEGPQRSAQILLPGRTVNEKGGVFVNRDLRLQRLRMLVQAPVGSYPEWFIVKRLAQVAKKPIMADSVNDERALFKEMVSKREIFKGLTPMKIGDQGLSVLELQRLQSSPQTVQAER
jgi:hypothetical protein